MQLVPLILNGFNCLVNHFFVMHHYEKVMFIIELLPSIFDDMVITNCINGVKCLLLFCMAEERDNYYVLWVSS